MDGSSNYVEVEPGVKLYVQDWGEGKPILFIHGWPLNHRMFEYQTMALPKQGFRVIALDLRGFGMSDKPWNGYDYDTWVQDIRKVIDALKLRDVTLVGFSIGGAIAMHYAATQNDDRVSKLVLIAAAGPSFVNRPKFPHGVPTSAVEGLIQGEKADRAKLKQDFGNIFFHKAPSEPMARFYESLGMQASAHASLRGLEELRDEDLTGEIGSIRIPTRIFHGVNDKVVPFELGEVQRESIPGSQLIRFESSGHAICYEESDKVIEELARFVSEEIETKSTLMSYA
ncbi:MAG TPA: alpha/beta hydrolase [Methanomassiliicoccales archaeon]|jgi:pimeloyl-ACP methyl ester carboxylesterase